MSEILFRYERLEPTTWAYLSALLIVALFFKFNRIWSTRNLDLVLLLLLAPGLLSVRYGIENASAVIEQLGYWWLFGINGLLLVRAFVDSAMVRRPLLEPNMNAPGMAFLAVTLFFFLMANVITGEADKSDLRSVQRAEHLSDGTASRVESSTLETHGPGNPLFFSLPAIFTERIMGEKAARPLVQPIAEDRAKRNAQERATATDRDEWKEGTTETQQFTTGQVVTAKVTAILSQMMIVLGMVLIGARHFGNISMGIAPAMLYLLLPYTAMWAGSSTHLLPAALMVWAVYTYRRPMLSGVFLGLAFGTIYYPVFLLPLWISYYWRKGFWRLLIGLAIALLALIVTQISTSTDLAMFAERMQQLLGIHWPQTENLSGAWHYWNPVYRWPILAAFLGLSLLSMPLWPSVKNLGTLLSGSAAIMLGVQFWHAHTGGLALAWYLPLLLLMIFRPNLEERVAANAVRG